MKCVGWIVLCAGLAAALLLTVAGPAGAATFKLETRTVAARDGATPQGADLVGQMVSSQSLSLMDGQRNPGEMAFSKEVTKQPAWKSALVLKGVLHVGDSSVAVAFDSTDLDNEALNRLVVDKNGNGDLSDDPVIEAKPRPANVRTTSRDFPPVELTVKAGEKSFTQSYRVNSYASRVSTSTGKGREEKRYLMASFSPSVYRTGKVELDGKSLQLVLVDFNSNGRFDDGCKTDNMGADQDGKLYPTMGDRLYWNVDGAKSNMNLYSNSGFGDMAPLSKTVGIDGKFYTASVTPSGDQITLEPAGLPMGKIKNDNVQWNVVLYGPSGVIKVSGAKGEETAVPAGEWKLLEYTIYNGSIYTVGALSAVGSTYVSAQGTNKCEAVKVEAGKTAGMPFGQPYKPVVGVRPYDTATGSKDLEMKLVGTAGEVCTGLTVNGKSPASPTFVIADAAGKKVASGAFTFG